MHGSQKENAGRRIRKHVVEYMLCHSMEGSTKGGGKGGLTADAGPAGQ